MMRGTSRDCTRLSCVDEIAFDRLEALLAANLVEDGKIKEFYLGLSTILRHYIEERFRLRARKISSKRNISAATRVIVGKGRKLKSI